MNKRRQVCILGTERHEHNNLMVHSVSALILTQATVGENVKM